VAALAQTDDDVPARLLVAADRMRRVEVREHEDPHRPSITVRRGILRP
jgi:hypothetical protein